MSPNPAYIRGQTLALLNGLDPDVPPDITKGLRGAVALTFVAACDHPMTLVTDQPAPNWLNLAVASMRCPWCSLHLEWPPQKGEVFRHKIEGIEFGISPREHPNSRYSRATPTKEDQ